jgi:histidine phosphotransferase ChpT
MRTAMPAFAPTEIAELICTRLSHDLIGNIGAVSNALELMDDDPACLTDVRPILDISARTLTARQKFFRLAFGLDNACPKTINDLSDIATAYLATIGTRTAPIRLRLSVATPELYKVILPAVMALGDLFIRGGTLTVRETQNGLTIGAESETPLSAPKIQALQDVLKGRLPEDNPAQIAPMVYLLSWLDTKNIALTLTAEQNRAVLQIG